MDNNRARKTRRQNKVNKVHKNFRNDKQKTKYKNTKIKKNKTKKKVMQQADRLSLSPLWAPEWNYKQFFIYCVLKFWLLSNVLQIGRATFVSYSHSLDNSVAFSVVVFLFPLIFLIKAYQCSVSGWYLSTNRCRHWSLDRAESCTKEKGRSKVRLSHCGTNFRNMFKVAS